MISTWPLVECPERDEWDCLSVLQPWTDALLIGAKVPENRTWPTKHRGPTLLHAGRGYDGEPGEDDETIWDSCAQVGSPSVDFALAAARRGAILGIADLIACVRPADVPQPQRSAWAFGPWCFVFARPLLFREPVPYRGERGIFKVPRVAVGDALSRAVPWLDLDVLPVAPPIDARVTRGPRDVTARVDQLSLW